MIKEYSESIIYNNLPEKENIYVLDSEDLYNYFFTNEKKENLVTVKPTEKRKVYSESDYYAYKESDLLLMKEYINTHEMSKEELFNYFQKHDKRSTVESEQRNGLVIDISYKNKKIKETIQYKGTVNDLKEISIGELNKSEKDLLSKMKNNTFFKQYGDVNKIQPMYSKSNDEVYYYIPPSNKMSVPVVFCEETINRLLDKYKDNSNTYYRPPKESGMVLAN